MKVAFLLLALLMPLYPSAQSTLPPCPESGWRHNCSGTWNYADGAKYVGEFKDNKFDGQGTITWANDGNFVGGFKDGKRHGHGTTTLVDG